MFSNCIYIGVVQGEEVTTLLIGNKDDDQAHKVMDPEAAREFAKYHQLLFMMDPEAARELQNTIRCSSWKYAASLRANCECRHISNLQPSLCLLGVSAE